MVAKGVPEQLCQLCRRADVTATLARLTSIQQMLGNSHAGRKSMADDMRSDTAEYADQLLHDWLHISESAQELLSLLDGQLQVDEPTGEALPIADMKCQKRLFGGCEQQTTASTARATAGSDLPVSVTSLEHDADIPGSHAQQQAGQRISKAAHAMHCIRPSLRVVPAGTTPFNSPVKLLGMNAAGGHSPSSCFSSSPAPFTSPTMQSSSRRMLHFAAAPTPYNSPFANSCSQHLNLDFHGFTAPGSTAGRGRQPSSISLHDTHEGVNSQPQRYINGSALFGGDAKGSLSAGAWYRPGADSTNLQLLSGGVYSPQTTCTPPCSRYSGSSPVQSTRSAWQDGNNMHAANMAAILQGSSSKAGFAGLSLASPPSYGASKAIQLAEHKSASLLGSNDKGYSWLSDKASGARQPVHGWPIKAAPNAGNTALTGLGGLLAAASDTARKKKVQLSLVDNVQRFQQPLSSFLVQDQSSPGNRSGSPWSLLNRPASTSPVKKQHWYSSVDQQRPGSAHVSSSRMPGARSQNTLPHNSLLYPSLLDAQRMARTSLDKNGQGLNLPKHAAQCSCCQRPMSPCCGCSHAPMLCEQCDATAAAPNDQPTNAAEPADTTARHVVATADEQQQQNQSYQWSQGVNYVQQSQMYNHVHPQVQQPYDAGGLPNNEQQYQPQQYQADMYQGGHFQQGAMHGMSPEGNAHWQPVNHQGQYSEQAAAPGAYINQQVCNQGYDNGQQQGVLQGYTGQQTTYASQPQDQGMKAAMYDEQHAVVEDQTQQQAYAGWDAEQQPAYSGGYGEQQQLYNDGANSQTGPFTQHQQQHADYAHQPSGESEGTMQQYNQTDQQVAGPGYGEEQHGYDMPYNMQPGQYSADDEGYAQYAAQQGMQGAHQAEYYGSPGDDQAVAPQQTWDDHGQQQYQEQDYTEVGLC